MSRMEFDILVEVIREAREEADVSQRSVAREMGFHPTVYGKIERGERVLDVIEFVDAAHAIGIDPLELFGRYLVAVQKAKVTKGAKKKGG